MELNPDGQSAFQAPKSKRGGRKPGSKNKPKVKSQLYTQADMDAMEQAGLSVVADRDRQIAELKSAAGPDLPLGLTQARALLEQIATIRVSAMDSESRLAEMVRRQASLAGQALAALRTAL